LAASQCPTPPATSCLGAFRPPAAGERRWAAIPAAENLHKTGQRVESRCGYNIAVYRPASWQPFLTALARSRSFPQRLSLRASPSYKSRVGGESAREPAMIITRWILSIAAMLGLMFLPSAAQTQVTEKGREIPGYFLPVPDDLSPQMRGLVAAPPAPWDFHPKNIEEWKELVAPGVLRPARDFADDRRIDVAVAELGADH